MTLRAAYDRAFRYRAADAGVPGLARPAELAITTPDPRFDPRVPVIVNGFRFVPACRPYTPGDSRGAEALQVEADAVADHASQYRRKLDPLSFLLGLVVAGSIPVGLWAWSGVLHG